MAITENDLTISNQSYTNKDFDSIYNEIINLAKKISYKYDPTVSNESDPFIVLLKLLAFCGDKINYNIDKNILERFMPSATQESSMNDLTARMGYNMHYYKAATTGVIFKYTYPDSYVVASKTLNYPTITIPKFTVVENQTNDLQYITLKDAQIRIATGVSDLTEVKQGIKKRLTVLNNEIIQLENLDEYNRLYFPETFVAQNGVFVEGNDIIDADYIKDIINNDGYWICVDNLNTQEYNKPCYTFRYDSSKNLPYIEFPEWINNIIGSGLTVDYLTCDGVNGNVYANSLTQVDSYTMDETAENALNESLESLGKENFTVSDITVLNSSSASNGANPETIDEAYQGFKKTIGTFDTLVTCRDYANAIYNMLDSITETNIVSNVQVADRRDDINYSLNVIGYDKYGVNTVSRIPEKTTNSVMEPIIKAFDLCLYPLDISADVTDVGTSTEIFPGYKNTFKPKLSTDDIKYKLEDSKTISHDYKTLKSGDIYLVKNYYKLDAIISTASKVNTLEELEIIKNVKQALAKKFNSRELDYGYEIAFDILQSTIENADPRIKNVSLKEPEQTTKIMVKTTDGEEEKPIYKSDSNPGDEYKFIVGKNIFAGKISMFEYDTRFDYTLGQKGIDVSNSGVKYISTYANKSVNVYKDERGGDDFKANLLSANEVIQFIAPNYITDVTYPYGVNYYLKLASASASSQKKLSSLTYTLDTSSTNSGTLKLTFDDNSTEEIDRVYSFETKTNEVDMKNQIANVNNKLEYDLVRWTEDKSSNYQQTISFANNGTQCIQKNVYYTLKDGDILIFKYTNSSKEDVVITYAKGDTIKCKLPLYTSAYRKATKATYTRGETPTETVDGNYFYTLSTNQEVEHLAINQELINSPKYIYWYLKDADNKLKWIAYPNTDNPEYYYYLLGDNEYFFYSDVSLTVLNSYGSGTKLKITKETYAARAQWVRKKVDNIANVIVDGLQYLKQNDYLDYFEFDTINKQLNIIEQNIVTLTENDLIYVKGNSETIWTLKDNYFEKLPDNYAVSYKLDGSDWENLTQISVAENNWQVRALLDICAGPDISQTLIGNQELKYQLSTESEPSHSVKNKTFKFSKLEQLEGGEYIYLGYSDLLDSTIKYPYIESYELSATPSLSSYSKHIQRLDFKEGSLKTEKIYIPKFSGEDCYILLFPTFGVAQGQSESILGVKIDNGTLINYNTGVNYETWTPDPEKPEETYYKIPKDMSIMKLSGDYSYIQFRSNNIKNNILVSDPRFVKTDGINKNLGLGNVKLTDLETYLRDTSAGDDIKFGDAFKYFYATSYIDNTKAVEVSDDYNLANPLSFYDYNNIANKWVLPEIDLDKSDIRIAKSSKK